MERKLHLDPKTTALLLVDLQNDIVTLDVGPNSSSQVVANAQLLATAFRAFGSVVALISVEFSQDGRDALNPNLEIPASPGVGHHPPGWSSLVSELNIHPSDIKIKKRQWGAFYGTELDLQLRRRNIRTIILAGLSTNIGVESTARDAFERGYNQIFVCDAMASPSIEAHNNTFQHIFPRIGIIRSTAEVILALNSP